MKLATLVLSCVFAGVPLELRWKAEAGAEFERTFELETRLELEERVVTVDGERAEDDLDDELGIRSLATETYVFVDAVESVASARPARPARLVRRFESLAQSDETRVEAGEESETSTTTFESALEGRSVRFTWDDELGAYEREFVRGADEEAGTDDDALLGGLEEDLDLRGLLPRDAVELGAVWDVDVRVLDRAFRPGGDLHMLGTDEEGDAQDFDRHVDDAIDATLQGSVTATFASVREVGGRDCAVIAIEGESTASGAFDDEDHGKVTIELSSDARGEVVWDVRAGCVVSASLEASVRTRLVRTIEFEIEGESAEYSDDMTFAGTTKVALKVVAR